MLVVVVAAEEEEGLLGELTVELICKIEAIFLEVKDHIIAVKIWKIVNPLVKIAKIT
jgi:hypothetical protein